MNSPVAADHFPCLPTDNQARAPILRQQTDADPRRHTAHDKCARTQLDSVVRCHRHPQPHELMGNNLNLARLASTDPLTETYNRRHFFELGDTELARATRHQRPLSVIMLDVDRFKAINDTYGHSAGDQALIALAQLCKQVGRGSDIIARFGGEEFAICCPDTYSEGARALAERLREQVEAMQLEIDGKTIAFTISLGVATAGNEDTSLEGLLKRADKLMYQAKNDGRNLSFSDQDEAPSS